MSLATLCRTVPLALVLAAHPAFGQRSEIWVASLVQKAAAAAPYSESTYRHAAIRYAYDTSEAQDGPRFLFSFGFGTSSSGDATYRNSSGSGRYHPGGYVSAGALLMSPGRFSFGGGIEGRFGTEYRFGSSGDTAGGGAQAPSKVFPWVILRLRYLFGTGPEARFLAGAHLGVGGEDGAYPSKEAGLFLGVRY